MALVIDSKIGATSTTTGTGTYTLAGAISSSWAPFTDIADGNTTWYLAEEDGVGWEVGTGTFTLSGTTLARTTVLKSSNADAAVNWATGTRKIYVVTPDFIIQYLADSGLGGDGTNTAAGTNAFTGGGRTNVASADDGTVSGGQANSATSAHATVGGGFTNLASGGQSFIGGGQDNVASGPRSVIAGGKLNAANGASEATIGGGLSNTVSSTRAAGTVAGGESNTVNANHAAIAGGKTNSVTGEFGVVSGGRDNLASAKDSHIPGGRQATTRALVGSSAQAANMFAAQGDAQVTHVTLMKETTDGTISKMTSDGTAGSILNMPVVPVSYAFLMTGKVLAWDSANDDRAAYDVEVLVYRDLGGTMALQYSNFTTIDGDDLVAWGGLTVTANNTNKAIELKCQGAAATTIHWVGNFDIIEIG